MSTLDAGPAGAKLDVIAAEKRDAARDALAVSQRAVEALQIGNRELFAHPANLGVAARDDGRVSVDHNFTFWIAAQTRYFPIQVDTFYLFRGRPDQLKISGHGLRRRRHSGSWRDFVRAGSGGNWRRCGDPRRCVRSVRFAHGLHVA